MGRQLLRKDRNESCSTYQTDRLSGRGSYSPNGSRSLSSYGIDFPVLLVCSVGPLDFLCQLEDLRLQCPTQKKLEGLVRDLQSQGVGVVLLNMPVSDYYIALHRNGMRDYTRYLGELTDLTRRRNHRFFDFGHEVSSLELFRDPTYLNGGERLESVG